MMDKKKLANQETPLNGYMEDAYALTVAISRDSNYEWIYSNYIQLVFQDPIKYDNQPIKFYKVSFKNGYIWDADCPLLCYDSITRDMIEMLNIDIIDFICKSIFYNNYVKVYLDEFYLPYRFLFKNKHYIHESLFFGFDYEKKELYGLAYVTDKTGYHFKEFAVNMDDVRQAYYAPIGESVQKERIVLMSCNREKYYEFDKENVKRSIFEYINSVQTDLRFTEINNPNESYIFGISIYDELIAYYKNGAKTKSVIPLHIIYEHKKLMVDRIKYMVENQYISNAQDIIDNYLCLIDKSYKCKLLFLKYKYADNDTTYQRLEKCIYEIKAQDEELMERLYLLLDEKVECSGIDYKYSRWGLWRDVAYPLGKRIHNSFEIAFYLHIINDKSRGYIRVTNEKCLNNYYAPFILKFDAGKEQFFIADSFDKNNVVLEGIKCKKNNVYLVRFIIDLANRKYCIVISESNQLIKHESIYSEEVGKKLQYINYIAAIHENSYRFAVSKLKCNNTENIKNLLQ